MGQIPGRHRAEFPASDLLQPDVFVSTVAPAAVGPLGGSFFCQIHNRGFASEQFFFEHLQAVDGLAPEVARGVLIENGGTWMFVGFPAGE